MIVDDKSRKTAQLLFALDVFTALFSILLAYGIRIYFFDPTFQVTYSYLAMALCAAFLFGGGQKYAGSYRRLRINTLTHLWIVVSGLAFSLGALLTVMFFIFHDESFSRSVIISYSVVVTLLVVADRAFLVWYYFKRKSTPLENKESILIIGSGERASRIADLVKTRSEWGANVIGYLDVDPKLVGSDINGDKILGTIDQIHKVISENVVDEVIVAVPRSMIDLLGKVFAACEEEGITVKVMSDIFDFQVARMRLSILKGVPLLSFEPVAQNESALLVKRMFDISAVLLAMPILLPVFLLIALAIKMESRGPVFFVQNRVGLRKRVFPMYKFRSMVIDAEEKLKELEHLNESAGPNFKIADDPRVTKVGSFIRKTSLDELPQLINVLLGHMTLVGPRPMSIRDVNLFDRGVQRKRFSVRPGLTCIWQISGRSNLSFEKWLELDLTYIENWSLRLDFEILIKTIPVLLKREGAY